MPDSLKKQLRVYVDTCVFGGVEDQEFAEPSKKFFDQVNQGYFQILISDIVRGEILLAPPKVRSIFEEIPINFIEMVPSEGIVLELAELYIKANAVNTKSRNDAKHVAAATVAGADFIISWNFKHIVNAHRIRIFNSVNIREGFKTLDIRSPYEVLIYEE